jgi:hypothetical protein
MALILIVGALEDVMDNCLRNDSTAMGAGGHFGAAYTKEVLIEWGVGCTKLRKYGGLPAVEVIN